MIMAANCQCLMNGWRRDTATEISLWPWTRVVHLFFAHMSPCFRGSSAKCVHAEARIYFGQVSVHLLSVCMVQMLVFPWINCTDTCFGKEFKADPSSLVAPLTRTRAKSLLSFPSPFRCEMFLYSEYRQTENWKWRKWHKQSNRIGVPFRHRGPYFSG